MTAVDVVVLAWNDAEMLEVAVASALGSIGVEPSVWVVDNGSFPPVRTFVDTRVRLVRNTANRGVAPARAQGVALGDAPFVCLLDSDARLEPSCLSALLDEVATDGRIALAAPVFVDQVPEASAGAAPTLGRKAGRVLGITNLYGKTGRAPANTTWDVDFAIGACQVIRRAAFEAVGGLDETIFYGPEDVDLCLRLRAARWRVVQVAGARCHHPPRRRNRRLLTRRGAAHARAVVRHLWRHRGRAHESATPVPPVPDRVR